MGGPAPNAAGIIDSAVPGPGLTDLGQQQAHDVANQLSVNRYDGIYASTMVRTQEIEVGSNEGLSVRDAPEYPAPRVWLTGHRHARIPGGDRRRGIRGGVQ